MSYQRISNIIAIIYLMVFSMGCKKFLDAKPNQAQVTPTNIADARALLDAYSDNQDRFANLSHASNDDYYVDQAGLQSVNETTLGIYLFTIKQESVLQSIWSGAFSSILRTNLVLDFLKDYQPKAEEIEVKNDCLGHAHFLRAFRHFNLSLYFAKPYLAVSARQTAGLPIRRTPNINEPTVRGTLEETYSFILENLEMAISLLPQQPTAFNRPGKAAAYTLKAWVLLHMQRFEEALQAAEASLAINNSLMDFNTINPNASFSFTRNNAEVLFQAQISGNALLNFNLWKADSLLYASYGPNDLRKVLYFASNGVNSYGFKGDYTGALTLDQFAGISTSETYMIAAEAAARAGRIEKAMQWLNSLLVKRYKSGTYNPYTAATSDEAFEIIREERRKEFAGRGLRWFDLRRWNYEDITNISISRIYNGTTYSLTPKSKNFVFEIPDRVVTMSGIEQNVRE
jgi:tetratricopeptide (TPR) repeat protein